MGDERLRSEIREEQERIISAVRSAGDHWEMAKAEDAFADLLERMADELEMGSAHDRAFRLASQFVFQDPYSSLDPRQKVERIHILTHLEPLEAPVALRDTPIRGGLAGSTFLRSCTGRYLRRQQNPSACHARPCRAEAAHLRRSFHDDPPRTRC